MELSICLTLATCSLCLDNYFCYWAITGENNNGSCISYEDLHKPLPLLIMSKKQCNEINSEYKNETEVETPTETDGTYTYTREKVYPISFKEIENFSDEEAESNIFNHNKVVACYIKPYRLQSGSKGSSDKLIGFVSDIDPNLCTHLIYGFAGIDEKTGEIKFPYKRINDNDDWYDLFAKYKSINVILKTFLSIGGPMEGVNSTKILQNMVAHEKQRKIFVESTVKVLREYELDGLDIYFQKNAGPLHENNENYLQLFEELRDVFDKHNLQLTAAFGPAKITADSSKVVDIAILLDKVYLRGYGYPNSPFTHHHAPIQSVQDSVNDYLEKGIPANKLVLGLSTFGKYFRLNDSYKWMHRDGPALGERVQNLDNEHSLNLNLNDNFLIFEPKHTTYNEIVLFLRTKSNKEWYQKCTLYWDILEHAAFLRERTTMISFDIPWNYKEKANLILEKRLGGVMIWQMFADDYLGYSVGTKYPLLKKLNYCFSNSSNCALFQPPRMSRLKFYKTEFQIWPEPDRSLDKDEDKLHEPPKRLYDIRNPGKNNENMDICIKLCGDKSKKLVSASISTSKTNISMHS